MPKSFVRFPSIEQFRSAIKEVKSCVRYRGRDEHNKPIYDASIALPCIEMRGTVKLHGTNAGVGFSDDAGIWAQSRNMILEKNDSYGFRQFVLSREETFKRLLSSLPHTESQTLCVFGEFCGKGVQRGVALQELPKMFVVFAAASVDGECVRWLTEAELSHVKSPDDLVYNIHDFDTWTVAVDFNCPEAVQDRLADITDAVEQQCPVAHALGADGVGEGVVWTGQHESVGRVCFKVKGQKHKVVKNKKNKSVPVDTEKVKSVRAFIEYALPENRFLQAIEQVFTSKGETPTPKKMRDFIVWVQGDVKKEESDTLADNNLQEDDVGKEIATAARNWLLEYCKKAD